MVEFIPPTQTEVYQYFLGKLKDESVAVSMSNRYFYYNEHNDWTVKKGKIRTPIKNWKLNINTWIRNMRLYSPVENVKLASKKICNETE